ncbi:hypothetical protein CIB95_12005 [Lottiidibacillus patelloidae]|uniref:GAF domain-containing protein n=1 Tax=Lottiidibacillus patelloidae TaxID=2670334 RepID=A0A263BS00_9BACI|nr:hypothetical protein [Lottiidibacillus patelloidae]OZM56493.1 hypothetical protein CIB95_12005 [Lottiidibacillus patelloidae]
MNNDKVQHPFYESLQAAADHTLHVISQFVGVNTFCVASNDKVTSLIFSAFHRKDHLFDAGTELPFTDAY